MARPSLQRNRKWPRLVRALGGDEATARGSLELLWDVAYENGDEHVGTADDVELAARWRGQAGVLARALADAGGEGEAGFIEPDPGRPGRYIVHDLWDHAPEYVRKRRTREAQRRTTGAALRRAAASDRSLSSQPGRGGGDDGGATPRNDELTGQCLDSDRRSAPDGKPPAPAPAPAPQHASVPPADGVQSATGQAEGAVTGQDGERQDDPVEEPPRPVERVPVLDLVEVPDEEAAHVRAAIEEHLGYQLKAASDTERFIAGVRKLGRAFAVQVAIADAERYHRRTGQRIDSLGFFCEWFERVLPPKREAAAGGT